jgi:hypothetical protein
MEPVDKFPTKMYHTKSHFVFTVTPDVFTVTRDFVRNCRTPRVDPAGRYPLPSPWRRRC